MNELSFIWKPLWNSALIGILSASGCLLVGVPGGIGFARLSLKSQMRWELPLLWGGFIPALYVALGVMNLWSDIPFGLGLVVLAHMTMNVGWVVVKTAELISTRMSGLQELALVEGASAWRFWSQAGVRFLVPAFRNQFRVIFALCFGSFVIPLLLGGPHWETLEVTVYRELRMSGPSGTLGILLLIQFCVIAFVGRDAERNATRRIASSGFIAHRGFGSVAAFVPAIGIALVGAFGILLGLGGRSFNGAHLWLPKLVTSAVGLVFLSAFLWCGCLLWTWSLGKGRGLRLWMGIGALSPVAIGFLILWMGSLAGFLPFSDDVALVLGTFAYACLILPLLLKLELQEDVMRLQDQMDVAESLGASRWQRWTRILLPQICPQMGRLVGIGAFWGMGEVALMGLFSKSDQTLALEAQAMMGAYRLENATGIVCLSVFVGALGYLLNRSIGNVGCRRT